MIDRKHAGHTLHHSETIYEGRVFSFVSDDITLDGQESSIRREYIAHPGAVAIVPVRMRETPEVLLVSQYRHPVGAVLWEIPAGLLDKGGEDPLEAAKRELAEEAGLDADTWHVLVDLFSSPGCLSESLRVYLARDVRHSDLVYERTEEEADMEHAWIPLDEAVRLVHEGSIHNATTITGLLSAASALAGRGELRSPDAAWLR
ncbi:NUDIX hydrolase [Flaviflexus salsibiostraticola]|uniref:NUDIX hydrolase n=1 Tax=Flaviflexus salsibiostraticola TaxID=1282737 RepID=A0A3S8Z7F6_9ACTO|nr:NUDIX hydrolase [Flaviflexus salsibiostraticola]AZN29430.1 NUDIX hydrolase [Flaviflexus salsibiostraticola]